MGDVPALPQPSSAQVQQTVVLVVGLMQWGVATHCLCRIVCLGSLGGTRLAHEESPSWLLCPAGTSKLPAAARRHLVD